MTFPFTDLAWVILSLPVAAVCLLTLAGYVGQLSWLFDLASHFRVQYLFILAASTMLFLVARQPVAALGAAFFGLLNLAAIIPLYVRPASALQGGRSYRLLLANVLQSNRSFGKVRELIRSVRPDFIVLIETNHTWLGALWEIRADYPYSSVSIREDNFGILLFSRIPVGQTETRSFGKAMKPSVLAHFDLEGLPFTIVATHPPPPKGAFRSAQRNHQLAALAEFAAERQSPMMLCGDLNLSPWSVYFRRLVRDSGLHDSTLGFGLQPTWPVNRPLLRVPIDHCLVSPGIRIQRRETGPFIGSDHFPVILDFTFR